MRRIQFSVPMRPCSTTASGDQFGPDRVIGSTLHGLAPVSPDAQAVVACPNQVIRFRSWCMRSRDFTRSWSGRHVTFRADPS